MEKLAQFCKDIFTTPIAEMHGWHFVILALVSVIAVLLVIKLLKFLFKTVKLICRGVKNICSAKNRCKKIQCRTCGRTLDKCVCQKNKDKGYVSRLYSYRREIKELRKENKNSEK